VTPARRLGIAARAVCGLATPGTPLSAAGHPPWAERSRANRMRNLGSHSHCEFYVANRAVNSVAWG